MDFCKYVGKVGIGKWRIGGLIVIRSVSGKKSGEREPWEGGCSGRRRVGFCKMSVGQGRD